MADTDPSTLLADDALLPILCQGFYASSYYRKAIDDIRYVREQAIRDLLSEHLPKQRLAELGPLESVVVAIRINYYRHLQLKDGYPWGDPIHPNVALPLCSLKTLPEELPKATM